MEAAIGTFDNARLVPLGADGKPAAGSFADARQFARDVYDELVTAQRERRVAEVVLPGEYGPGLSMPDVFDEAERIVRIVAMKVPGGASRVEQVTVRIRSLATVRRIIRLRREGSSIITAVRSSADSFNFSRSISERTSAVFRSSRVRSRSAFALRTC